MQLSPSVPPADPQLAALAASGAPARDASPVDPDDQTACFDSLMPEVNPGSNPVPAKGTDPVAQKTAEAAAAVWSSWLAALTPTTPLAPVATDATPDVPLSPSTNASPADVKAVGDSTGGSAKVSPGAVGSAAIFPFSPTGRAPFSARDFVTTPLPGTGPKLPPTAGNDAAKSAGTVAIPIEQRPDAAPTPPAPIVEMAALTATTEGQPKLEPPRISRSASRGESGGNRPMEKIAGLVAENLPEENLPIADGNKNILSDSDKQVTSRGTGIGTAIAMAEPVMSTTLSHASPAPTAAIHGASASAERAASPAPVAASNLIVAPMVHRAVEAVMSAADRIGSGTKSSVHLQFTVGGSDLSVRVELRAGEVHTTFRTDSGELRTALATAWETVSGNSDRANRLAEPVFTTANSSGATASAGDAATQQRGSGGRPAPEQFEMNPSRPLTSRAAAPAESSAGDARPAVLRPNLNLYTFA